LLSILMLGVMAAGAPLVAQTAGPGPRSVSVMGGTFAGAFAASDNTPMIQTRYRIGVTPLSAAEFDFGVARMDDGGCLVAVSDGTFDDCGTGSRVFYTAGITQGLYVPVGPLRPYALAGVGAVIASEYGIGGFGLVGGGLAVRVLERLAARAEVGRRFNGDGGATHFMAGFELEVSR
jgi:hypothetical protein